MAGYAIRAKRSVECAKMRGSAVMAVVTTELA